MPVTITKDNHQQEVLESSKPVLLDVYATWCGPCQMMNPIIDHLETEYESSIVVAKLNVDDARELAIHYAITSIPTFIFIKNGVVVDKQVGSRTKEELITTIKTHLL